MKMQSRQADNPRVAAPATGAEGAARKSDSLPPREHFNGLGRLLGIGALSLSALMGCDDKRAAQAPAPNLAPTSPQLPPAAARKAQEISYDLPLLCPPGEELIADGTRAKLNRAQLVLINSAYYLWKVAVADQASARDKLARQIPIAPSPEQMPKDDPFFGPIEAALAPLDLKAAYVSGVVSTEKIDTKEKQDFLFRFLVFARISPDTSFLSLVGAIGHECHHAIQGEKDDLYKVGKSFQQTAWREMDAYGREVQDLLLVAKFLRESPSIDAELRARNLDSWLTDTAGQVYSAGFYSHRFKVQYLASALSNSLGNIDAFLQRQNTSETAAITPLREQLAPLLQYTKDLPIDTKKLEATLTQIEGFIARTPALGSSAEQKTADRTVKFLESVQELRSSIPQLIAAEERLRKWKESPAPLPPE